jgi:predicted O-linked N-acetylglucosamine transferase (SPINDLY family)
MAGIFTERDVMTKVVAARRDPDTTLLAEVMTPNPDTIAPDNAASDALDMMRKHNYRHLPVVDGARLIAPPPSRAEAGLPEEAFVFCAFNNNFKITAPVFDIWMRLLQHVPGSVLWLREGVNETLRREAVARGVAPERLVFAAHVPLEVHHARHQLADLFLDTLPYNAHATAADALWAGLPVLTRLGETYPGRVAASLVTAAGLPELVTQSAEEYESLALALARDPARLKALREKLAANRATAPLFDTPRLARNIEAAYLELLKKA